MTPQPTASKDDVRSRARGAFGQPGFGAGYRASFRLAALLPILGPSQAFAHGTERGLVMLLPTGYAQAGGAVAVAASFLALAVLPERWFQRIFALRLPLFPVVMAGRHVISCLSFLVLAGLLAIGFSGTHDPLANLLPLTIWTVWWIGLTLVQAVVGNLWPWLNPWTGPLAVLRGLGLRNLGRVPLVRLPAAIGHAPAILLFFGFAWYELVSLSPQDPPQLAMATGGYWLLTLVAMAVFGVGPWTQRGEPFSVFFRMIGLLAPLRRTAAPGQPGRRVLALVWPGARCIARRPLTPSGTLFVLLTLASVSFDGFSFTFTWLALIGINPLEFPGRSAVIGANTAGFLATTALLSALFYLSVHIGNRFAGLKGGAATLQAAGHLVYSIVPISIAFHLCHYLTILLVNGQFFLLALSDSLSRGWDLLAIGHRHVTASFMNDLDSVTVIWTVQIAIIVVGHVVGILLAHMIAFRRLGSNRLAVRSQVMLAATMVFYTAFGLWLLSTPVAG